MFCGACGTAVGRSDKVCSDCGASILPEAQPKTPMRLSHGFAVLGTTATVLNALAEGKVIRRSIAIAMQISSFLAAGAGLIALIQVLKFSFQFPSPTATIGGLLVAVLLVGLVFAICQVYLFRAQCVRELPDSPFTVIPILSILFRTTGEVYALVALTVGVGGCLFMWMSGMNPRMLLAPISEFLPGVPTEGQSFLDGLIFLAWLAGAAFAILVLFYALAELVVVAVDIAINVRRMVPREPSGLDSDLPALSLRERDAS